MKARGSHQSRAEPSRGAKSDSSEPGMSRTNSSVQFQAVSLVAIQMLPCINHNWRRATMLFRPAQ
jgi:hypothetical protein